MNRWIRIFISAVLLVLVGDITFYALAPQGVLIREVGPRAFTAVDAEVVFFHGFNKQWNGLSNETKRRLDYAISLFNKGQAGILIPCGGNKVERELSGAGLMADYARLHGVPRDRIFVESSSYDSATNIQNILKLMKDKGFRSAVFISSPHHIKRLRKISQETGGDFKITFASYSPSDCQPALSRLEIWQAAHYDFLANLAQTILPAAHYKGAVLWIRHHTDY